MTSLSVLPMVILIGERSTLDLRPSRSGFWSCDPLVARERSPLLWNNVVVLYFFSYVPILAGLIFIRLILIRWRVFGRRSFRAEPKMILSIANCSKSSSGLTLSDFVLINQNQLRNANSTNIAGTAAVCKT